MNYGAFDMAYMAARRANPPTRSGAGWTGFHVDLYRAALVQLDQCGQDCFAQRPWAIICFTTNGMRFKNAS